jgi:hypothetical protein
MKRSTAEVSVGIHRSGIAPEAQDTRKGSAAYVSLSSDLLVKEHDGEPSPTLLAFVRMPHPRRNQALPAPATRREALAGSDPLLIHGVKTEGNLNPPKTGSPSGVCLYRGGSPSMSTLPAASAAEKSTASARAL